MFPGVRQEVLCSELFASVRGYSQCVPAVLQACFLRSSLGYSRGTHSVCPRYSKPASCGPPCGTHGVLTGYSQGTHSVCPRYSKPASCGPPCGTHGVLTVVPLGAPRALTWCLLRSARSRRCALSKGTPRVLPGYSQGTPRVLPGYSQGSPRVLPRYSQGTPRVLPG